MTENMPRWTQHASRRLLELPRARKRALMLVADVIGIPAALWTAMTLKAGAPVEDVGENAWLYLAALLATVPVFVRLGLYRAVVRFIGPRAFVAVVVGVSGSVALLLVVNELVLRKGVHISTFAIYWALALIYVGGSRLLARGLIQIRRQGSDRVAIYGAGVAGAQVASALLSGGRYYPVAFIDDSKGLHGSSINGIEVFGADELPRLIADEGVNTVLLALPSSSRRRRQEILHALEPLAVHVQTVPDISDIVTGRATVEDIQEVDAQDLLGRDPVSPRVELFHACVRGKSVMVTGAGGSIGSELSRQIARLAPIRVILFEMSELALYQIEREVRSIVAQNQLDVEVVALLGNAHHRQRVREVIHSYGVQTIYHAAAYKHVPIVEQNIIEGVHNNVFSTWYTAEAAIDCGVETFVLISTDKSVNPTNVMGATKRLAEIVLQALNERGSRTRFCMVRFGNVLESSGSVVPLFREQIRQGGPVTVTHPDVIRYFMTIPEATQLVLQAGAIAKGGDVLVLDMGKPVRIQDLARRMIRLMGLTVRDEQNPDGDIEIVYTGLRPAEKLFEELLIGGTVTGTEHPMIMRAVEHSIPWPAVQALLNELLEALNNFDCSAVRELLKRAVAEYRPLQDIQDHVWQRKQSSANLDGGKVTALQGRRAARAQHPHS